MPRLLREVQAPDPAPIFVAGPPSAAAELARALSRDGDPALVRRADVAELEQGSGFSALVYVIRGEPTPTDERVLRDADRHRTPVVCLVLEGRASGARVLPYVQATAVVRAEAIDATAVAAVAERLAARTGEAAWALAGALPVLRRPVVRVLIRRYARLNGAAAVVPATGEDFPVLTLNQLRMVLRIAAAYEVALEGARALALVGVAGTGLGFRALARRCVSALPLPGRACRAAVAYAGTRAIGEAALIALERSGDRVP